MISKKLEENGLINFMTGKEYSLFSRKIGEEKVISEIEDISNKNNIDDFIIYSGKQIHSDNIEYADGKNGDNFIYGRVFEGTDGLITDKNDVVLMIKIADCTPVIIYDPIKKVQASLHSGWRGTSKKISKKAIDILKTKYNSNSEDLIAFIGPTIDYKNYEVGKEIWDEFDSFLNRELVFKKHPNNSDKLLLDLREANLSILLESGIRKENIEISDISTYKSSKYHSYRRDKPDYHLNAIFSVIKK